MKSEPCVLWESSLVIHRDLHRFYLETILNAADWGKKRQLPN
jgi:hypothetical protein